MPLQHLLGQRRLHGRGNVGQEQPDTRESLWQRVILRCVVGSRAYGLAGPEADTDHRGVFLPPTQLFWGLNPPPQQLENDQTQEVYWELEKFLRLALRANPTVLEVLYTPLVEWATPLGRELLAMRGAFLSRRVCETYGHYAKAQLRRVQNRIAQGKSIRWKQVAHAIRLMLAGVHTLKHGQVLVRMDAQREQLLAIRAGKLRWEEVLAWHARLQQELQQAREQSPLPQEPDWERVNQFLIHARGQALGESLP